MKNGRIEQTDSDMIRFCRVVCIFFMMTVHFYPYESNETIINSGSFEIVGLVFIDFLGRASVATLSLISGYLLSRSLSNKSLFHIIIQRGQALLVPMITWNLVFLLAAILLTLVSVNSSVIPSRAEPLEILNAVTGFLGSTANESLFFIRDLFVSSVLIAGLWKIIRYAPIASLSIVAFLTLFDLIEPVIFRPMILFFMLAGCILHEKSRSLKAMAAPRVAILVILGCIVLNIFVDAGEEILPDQLWIEMNNMLLRVGLTAGMLMVALFCVKLGLHRKITSYEPSAYLAYLSHVLIAKFMWEISSAMGATIHNFGYVAFFFVTPFLIFWLARSAMPQLRRLPWILSRILTGKPREIGPTMKPVSG